MTAMLHISQLHKLVEKGEFSIVFVASEGYKVSTDRAICTSFHSLGRTMNIKFCDSEQIRKIRRCTIISFNGQEVCL
jgi:hypothetical protein